MLAREPHLQESYKPVPESQLWQQRHRSLGGSLYHLLALCTCMYFLWGVQLYSLSDFMSGYSELKDVLTAWSEISMQ